MTVLRPVGVPGKASPMSGGGRTAKRKRRRVPGNTVVVWSSSLQSGSAARVRCGELSGASVICNSSSVIWMSPAVAKSSCRSVLPSCSYRLLRQKTGQVLVRTPRRRKSEKSAPRRGYVRRSEFTHLTS